MSGLYAWLRRHSRLVDGALAVVLLLLGAGAPRPTLSELLLNLAFIIGLTLGVGLGVGFGAAIMAAFGRSAGGAGVLSLPYASITLYAAAAALAAAVLPARRAARTPAVTAMAQT